jgi:hypothetical protein
MQVLTSVIPSTVEESLTSQKWLALVLQPVAGETKLRTAFNYNVAHVIPNRADGEGPHEYSVEYPS